MFMLMHENQNRNNAVFVYVLAVLVFVVVHSVCQEGWRSALVEMDIVS